MPAADLEQRAYRWIRSWDTGLSSVTIWHTMMGLPWSRSWGPTPPRDPDDLGRCLGLFEILPEWRPRLPEVADRYPEWAPLVQAWDELEALYREEEPAGTAPRCYARMKSLEARA